MAGTGEPLPGATFHLPAGQEELVAGMLGRGEALSGGCAWQAAAIEGDRIVARYRCAGRDLDLTLLRAEAAPGAAVRTATLALAPGSGVPDGLLADVAARVRAREAELRWVRAGAPSTGGAGDPGAPSGSPAPAGGGAAGAGLALAIALGAAVAIAFLLVRAARRGAAPRLPPAAVRWRWTPPLAALAACGGVHAFLRALGQVLAAPFAGAPPAFLAAAAALGLGGPLAAGFGLALLRARLPRDRAAGLLGAAAGGYLALGAAVTLPPAPEPGFGGLVLPHGSGVERERSRLRPRITYRYNALGFREPEVPERKPPGSTRIALVGDSYVFGSGVPLEGTLAVQLAAELARTPGPPPEVLNLGVPGHNLSSHVTLALAAAERLEPDVLVICLTLANDLSRWDVQDERREASRLGAYSLGRFLLGDGVQVLWGLFLLERQVAPEGLAHLRRELDRLSELRGRPGPRVLFFRYTPREPEVDAVLQEKWPGAVIVGPPAYRAEDFISGDGHPTAEGNRRFAVLIAAALEAGAPRAGPP